MRSFYLIHELFLLGRKLVPYLSRFCFSSVFSPMRWTLSYHICCPLGSFLISQRSKNEQVPKGQPVSTYGLDQGTCCCHSS